MLELYHTPQSTCSQKVRLALAHKGLDWRSHLIMLSKNEHLTEDYLKLNPNGVVPTLVHDGSVISDSSVINEYLEDVFAEKPLRPHDPLSLARMRIWRQYIDEVPTPAIRVPSFNAIFLSNWSSMTEEEFEAHVNRTPIRKSMYRRMGRTGFPKEDIDEALEQLQQTLERMERCLEQGPWLNGQDYSLADISVTPTLVRMEDLGLSEMWSKLPQLADWFARIQALPNFAIAYSPGSRLLIAAC